MPPWCQEDWPLTQSPSLYDRPTLWRPQGADTRFEPSPLPTSETWDLQTWVDSFVGVSLSQKAFSEFLNVPEIALAVTHSGICLMTAAGAGRGLPPRLTQPHGQE
jgi:hypothetical protein